MEVKSYSKYYDYQRLYKLNRFSDEKLEDKLYKCQKDMEFIKRILSRRNLNGVKK